MNTKFLFLFLFAVSLYSKDINVVAVSVSAGTNESNYPTQSSKSKNNTIIGTYTTSLNSTFLLTGILGYTMNDLDRSTNDTNDIKVHIFGLAGTKLLGDGLSLSVSAIYSDSATGVTDLDGIQSSYAIDGSTYTTSIGLRQVIPTNKYSYTSLSGKITYTRSKTKDYTVGTRHFGENTNDKTYISLKAKQTWIFGEYKPNISLAYRKANKEFNAGSNDDDYFLIGLGLKKKITKDISLGSRYLHTLGRTYISSRSISFTLSKKF